MARADTRINDGASLYHAFLPRQDIRCVTTAESLPRRNFILHIGVALWELHFYIANAVQFRTNVTRKIFIRHVIKQLRDISFSSSAYTIQSVQSGEIAMRSRSFVAKSKTTTTQRSFVNCVRNSRSRLQRNFDID